MRVDDAVYIRLRDSSDACLEGARWGLRKRLGAAHTLKLLRERELFPSRQERLRQGRRKARAGMAAIYRRMGNLKALKRLFSEKSKNSCKR